MNAGDWAYHGEAIVADRFDAGEDTSEDLGERIVENRTEAGPIGRSKISAGASIFPDAGARADPRPAAATPCRRIDETRLALAAVWRRNNATPGRSDRRTIRTPANAPMRSSRSAF